MEIVSKRSPEDIEEYHKDSKRTIHLVCQKCGNKDSFTINEANDGAPCRRCRK